MTNSDPRRAEKPLFVHTHRTTALTALSPLCLATFSSVSHSLYAIGEVETKALPLLNAKLSRRLEQHAHT